MSIRRKLLIGLGSLIGVTAVIAASNPQPAAPEATPAALAATVLPAATAAPATPAPTLTPTATPAATPVATPAPAPTSAAAANCDPNYSGCVPIASDVDCAGGSGNGPAYVAGPVTVIGYDKYGLDRDGDGVACE